jgi:hypothetical protein
MKSKTFSSSSMDFVIPPNVKPGEIGPFLAYHLLGARTPREMQSVMHFTARSSAHRALQKIRKHVYTVKNDGSTVEETITASFVAKLQ